mgnify:CR=1 FL=1
MPTLTYTQARDNLADCLRTAVDDFDPVVIRRRNAPAAVLVNYDEYRAMAETLHVLGGPKNAQRLRESLAAVERHQGLIAKTAQELGL